MDDSNLEGFGDIATNFLGVLILMLLLLQGTVVVTEATRAPLRVGQDEPPSTFGTPLRDYLHPLTDHYYVAGNRIWAIDWAPLAAAVEIGAMTAGSGKREIPILGKGEPAAIIETGTIAGPDDLDFAFEGDLNAFKFPIVFPSLPGAQLPSKEEIGKEVDKIVARTQGGARAANFIVADTGFPLFAAVHKSLSRRHICFRWREYQSGSTLAFYRDRLQFSLYDSRKCKVRRT